MPALARIGNAGSGKLAKVDLASESIELRLTAESAGDAYALTLKPRQGTTNGH